MDDKKKVNLWGVVDYGLVDKSVPKNQNVVVDEVVMNVDVVVEGGFMSDDGLGLKIKLRKIMKFYEKVWCVMGVVWESKGGDGSCMRK